MRRSRRPSRQKRAARRVRTAIWCISLVAVLIFSVGTAIHNRNTIRDIAALEKANFELQTKVQYMARHIDQLEKAVRQLTVKPYAAVASWYGPGFDGRHAADGSIYNQDAFTLAHKTLPFGTIVVVEYNGKRVPAVVTDRGPFIQGRDFDLSKGLAERLGFIRQGVVTVLIYQVDLHMLDLPDDFFSGPTHGDPQTLLTDP